MPDSITVHDLTSRPPGDIVALPIEVLAGLAGSIADMKALVAEAEARLNAALDRRYGDRAHQLRAADDKDAGRVRLDDGDFVVIADLPKRVAWDQNRLAAITARIRDGGDDPSEFVRTTLEVSERAYAAWPSAIRRLFEPARTVRHGKPRYVIEARREEAA